MIVVTSLYHLLGAGPSLLGYLIRTRPSRRNRDGATTLPTGIHSRDPAWRTSQLILNCSAEVVAELD